MGEAEAKRRGGRAEGARAVRVWWPFWWLVCCVLAFPAHAIMREIDPGEAPKLRADEGLLLMAVDSNVALATVRISRQGLNLDMRTMRGVGIGQSARLYAVPAGRYRWSSVGYIGEFKLSNDPEFGFDVKPGVVNYPGDLVFRSTGWLAAMVHVSNRGLQAMDWLEKQHPVPFRDQRFSYTGHYPDPFPELYRAAIAGGRPGEDKTAALPPPGKLPMSLAELWWPSRVQRIELNPQGDLFAEAVLFRKARKAGEKDGDAKQGEGDWRWGIDLVDAQSGAAVRLYESRKPVSRLDWLGDRSLIISVGAANEPDALIVANILDDPKGRRYETVVVPRVGVLVKVLDREPGHILFASRSGDGVAVHKLDVRSQKAVDAFDFTSATRHDRGIYRGQAYFADGAGRIRMAIAEDKTGKRLLMYGGDGSYRPLMVLDETADFEPAGLSADGALIYGRAEHDRGQRDLVELDPATGQVTRTVFSKPGHDILELFSLFPAKEQARLFGA